MTWSKCTFIIRTAYRESRRNWGRIVLFMSSIVLGIAALVALNAFNDNLSRDIDDQAASLLGADMMIRGNRPVSDTAAIRMEAVPGPKAQQVELLSMAYIPKQDESQFVRMIALEGNYPFYGVLETEPAGAVRKIQSQRNKAVAEESLMLQYDLEIGDSLSLGESHFEIAGILKGAFGGTALASGFAPVVYIPMQDIDATQLIKPGSLVDYSWFFKVPQNFDPDEWKSKNRQSFRDESLQIETIEDRKENLDEAFNGLNIFLNLVAVVSLLLGCIGVASSVLIYVKSRIPSIAIFRCLGMQSQEAFLVYFLQIFTFGLLGVCSGAALGSVIQMVLPVIFSDLLPFEVEMQISWPAILEGVTIGLVVTMLFSLVPLVRIRKVSPLRTLRTVAGPEENTFDLLSLGIYTAIVVSIFLFLWTLSSDLTGSLLFTGGILLAFTLLYIVAGGLMVMVRRFFPRNWHFVLRQGLSNLFRPNNQTRTLLVSIGLGTAVLTTLFIIQGLLLENVDQMDAGNQPNMIVFGIESDQRKELAEMTSAYQMPVIQQVPIVTMRLVGWQGKSKAEWLRDSARTAEGWVIHREARVTYRDTLSEGEELLRGRFRGSPGENNDSIFISLAETFSEALDVDIGDEIIFNVQGARIKTYVGSIRDIAFNSMSTRFFIVFPTGVLEEAPQFHVLVTKSPDTGTTAAYRSAVVRTFPNISVLDLGQILEALSDILNKVSYVIQFMAIFSILTGLVVLLSALLLSKFQRIRESVLLRTLGATARQLNMINVTEYLMLGAFSALTGISIAILSSYLLARFQLDLDFYVPWLPILVVFVVVIVITAGIGILNSRDILSRPPLEVLRKDLEG